MNPVKEPALALEPKTSNENNGYENQWYSSVFELLRSSESLREDAVRNVLLKNLFECTHRYFNSILNFKNAAFYLTEGSANVFDLKYWEPATRESLFRRQIASLIKKQAFEWYRKPDSTHIYRDESSGSSLILKTLATPDHCFGVFAGMYEDDPVSESSQRKIDRVTGILQNLAQVLEVLAARNGLWPFKDVEDRALSAAEDDTASGQMSLFDEDAFPVNGKRRASKQPLYDFLTNLPSRALVEDRLNMALAHARYSGEKVAVVVLNVDNFKRVNDYMGIAAGDMLLRHLSQRIRNCLRDEDTLGRQGGDEFIILLPDIHLIQDVEFRVQKTLKSICGAFPFEGNEIHTSCSAGIAVYPDDGEDSSTLLPKAKAAMCQAKEEGKDRYRFYKSFMQSKPYRQMGMENSLREALERDEFRLYFQPKVSIGTGETQGMEALLRWEHPERGLILPSEFIPVAEETDLIQPIGEWVLLNACRQIKAWKRAGFPPIRIAVNLSGYQVNQPDWISTVQSVLDRTGVEPSALEMEITETVLMDNSDEALSNLRQMNEMGIRITIDDFGTGYSSLSYLKRFPIHTLKIDQSFIRGIKESGTKTDAVITKAIVSLAQALNLKTVAEGVEHVREMEYLHSIGCDDMQGYLFSKPLPVEQINFMFSRNLKKPVRSYWRPDEVPQKV